MPSAAFPTRAADPQGGADPLLAMADRCVQCGLCLPHCPTYRLDRLETESPRGRIALARALADATLLPDAAADTALDHCLGCRCCEAVCPSGVQYGNLLELVRAQQRGRRPAPWRQRAVEWLAARPALLDRMLGALRMAYPLVPTRLPRPPTRCRIAWDDHRAGAAAKNAAPAVAIFTGCLARRYDAHVHAALARLCAAVGVSVQATPGQTCCGTLHAHAGNQALAARLAARNRGAFAHAETVLTSASGCHEALAKALVGTASVQDAAVFLAARRQRLQPRPARLRAALHIPCTQRNVVRSDRALRELLSCVPDLDLVALPDAGCCGAAGMHMLAEPARAAAFRQPLLDAFASSGATLLLSANIGCRLHLAMGDARLQVRHPLEFLAEHLQGSPSP